MAILTQAMRRFFPLVLVMALVLPAAAWAATASLGTARAPGDGTLVVDNGKGSVIVRARGGVLGRFDQGSVIISDLDPTDGRVPVVTGGVESVQFLSGNRIQWSGDDIRFRMIGGLFRVQLNATGIDVSAVGRGTAVLDASDFTDFPGRYSLDGGPFRPLPGHATTYTLGQAPSLPAK
jgi:hypothetical protein